MDKNIIEKLQKIGFEYHDGVTYDEIRDWLYNEKKIFVAVLPCCGKKTGYNKFHLNGFLYEITPIDKNKDICLSQSAFNVFNMQANNYRYNDEDDDNSLKDVEWYPTPQIALQEGVKYAIDLYKERELIASYYGNQPKNERKPYNQYPTYLWLMDKEGRYHTPLVKYGDHVMSPCVFYKSADFDNHDYLVQVLFDKGEYIVMKTVNGTGYMIEGYQLYEAPKTMELKYQLMDKLKDDVGVDVVGIEEILDEMKKSEN